MSSQKALPVGHHCICAELGAAKAVFCILTGWSLEGTRRPGSAPRSEGSFRLGPGSLSLLKRNMYIGALAHTLSSFPGEKISAFSFSLFLSHTFSLSISLLSAPFTFFSFLPTSSLLLSLPSPPLPSPLAKLPGDLKFIYHLK